MVEVDGVVGEDVVAIGCWRINIFVGSASVERGVVEFADDEGDCVRCWGLLAAGLAEEVPSEGCMCKGAKVESPTHVASPRGLAASSTSEPGSVEGGGMLVVVRHRF